MRVIDSDALKDMLCRKCSNGEIECKGCDGESCGIIKTIDSTPTVEDKVARRCKMIPKGVDCRGYTSVFRCTACETDIYTDLPYREYDEFFCPRCGAEVDDGGSENGSR